MIALAGGMILRGFVRQELQPDETAERRVFRFVDYSHATAAQQFHKAVVEIVFPIIVDEWPYAHVSGGTRAQPS
jgi:hypothetical protein